MKTAPNNRVNSDGQKLESLQRPSSSLLIDDEADALRISISPSQKLEVDCFEVLEIGENYGEMRLLLTEVANFTPIHRWPNGPEVPWEQIPSALGMLGSVLVEIKRKLAVDGRLQELVFKFDSGSRIAVTPSARMPGSVKVVVLSSAAT
jgi:hypothetical protein